jgi:Holliday junction resolvase RusA-like endonuclease
MQELRGELGRLPPSANKIYVNTRNGRRKSQEAKEYIVWASTELAKQWAFLPKLDRNRPYSLEMRFYLTKVENDGWAERKTKTRYVKRDVTNLVKLLEDIISKASGVDDSATMESHVYKFLRPENPGVEIRLSMLEAP